MITNRMRSSVVLVLALVVAGTWMPNAVRAAPTAPAAAEVEAAEVRLATRTRTASARGRKSVPVATVTWPRALPAATLIDDAGSIVWRNKGAIGVGVGAYVAATHPSETLDALATLAHGPTGQPPGQSSSQANPTAVNSSLGSATVLGWLIQAVGPFLLAFGIGAAAVPTLRFIFRPKTR